MRQSRSLRLCGAIALICLAGCNDRSVDDTTIGDTADATRPATPDTDTIDRIEGNGQLGQGVDNARGTEGSNPVIVATAGGPGPYLANSAGSALYFVEGDTDGSKCIDLCMEAWPPFLVAEAAPTPGAQLQTGMLGTITRADGTVQVSYNQHPLYRYAADTGAGRTAGNDVEDKWGHWHLIGPGGDAVENKAQ